MPELMQRQACLASSVVRLDVDGSFEPVPPSAVVRRVFGNKSGERCSDVWVAPVPELQCTQGLDIGAIDGLSDSDASDDDATSVQYPDDQQRHVLDTPGLIALATQNGLSDCETSA